MPTMVTDSTPTDISLIDINYTDDVTRKDLMVSRLTVKRLLGTDVYYVTIAFGGNHKPVFSGAITSGNAMDIRFYAHSDTLHDTLNGCLEISLAVNRRSMWHAMVYGNVSKDNYFNGFVVGQDAFEKELCDPAILFSALKLKS